MLTFKKLVKNRLLCKKLIFFVFFLALPGLVSISCGGQKKSYPTGDDLGPAILGGGGSVQTRGQGVAATVTTPAVVLSTVNKTRVKPAPTFNIVPITMIVTAVDDRTNWNLATLPIIPDGTTDAQKAEKIYALGADTYFSAIDNRTETADNGAWPFRFNYTYPPNNFQLQSAHLVLETSRDATDTEGIFVDGVMSGRPPHVNETTTTIVDHVYANMSGNYLGDGSNTYYIDWSLAHYKRSTHNFYDLDFVHLLNGTSKTPYNIIHDGLVQAITGDDSPAYTAYLVINGLTISSDQLQCQVSSAYKFINTLVHNDGNSIGLPAFTGTIKPVYQAWSSPAGQTATEFYYDIALPNTPINQITLTSAALFLPKAKYAGGGCPMIVVNGVGVSSSSCNRSAATSVVESWDDVAGASATWTTFLSKLTTNSTGADVTLDLVGLFGADKVLTLFKQGKFNVALAGTLVAKSINNSGSLAASSARTYGTYVDGPELSFAGTYTINTCAVVNDPESPMTEAGYVEPPVQYETYQETVSEGSTASTDTVVNNGTPPVLASIQVLNISSSSATIYWTTDEQSSSQVKYGVLSPSTKTTVDSDLKTFHQVALTGLSPYTYYKYQVISIDQYGNSSTSAIAVFATLR